MCTVSMVMDHYQPIFPNYPATMITIPDSLSPAELKELRALVKEFKEALKAAKLLDRVLKQPDCEDPEKMKLEKRVAKLERQLARRA